MSESELSPHSRHAECMVLSALMGNGFTLDRVGHLLQTEDFLLDEHRAIYAAIVELFQRKQIADAAAVYKHIKSNDSQRVIIEREYLNELANLAAVESDCVIRSAREVRNKSVLRNLVNTCNSIVETAVLADVDETTVMLERARSEILVATHPGSGGVSAFVDIDSSIDEFINALPIQNTANADSKFKGVSTGFKDFDQLLSGLKKSEVTIIAGRPGMGSGTLASNIAQHVAVNQQLPVAVFSLGVSREFVSQRMLSPLTNISLSRLRGRRLDAEEKAKVINAKNKMARKILVDDTPALAVNELWVRCRALSQEKGGLELIMIDGLQSLRSALPTISGEDEMEEICRALKLMAIDLDIPVLVTSELSRDLEYRTDKRPRLKDLPECRAITQHADTIVFVYRDHVYDPESPEVGVAELLVRQNRSGSIGMVHLNFDIQHSRFENRIL